MRRILSLVVLVTLLGMPAFGQTSAVIDAAPTVTLPLAPTPDIYSLGFGGLFQVSLPLGERPLAGLGRVSYSRLALQADAGSVNLISGAVGAGYQVLNTGALSLTIELGAGGYAAVREGAPVVFNPSAIAGVRAAFSLGSGLELALRPSYEHHFASRDGAITSFFNGVGASLSIGIAPGQLVTGTRRPRIEIQEPVLNPLFPVIYKYYEREPFGSVRVNNAERSRIENLRIEFIAPQYMSAPQLIGEFPSLAASEGVDVPITALFSNDVLDITEPDAVQGQILVSYEVGGTQLETARTVTIRLYDRNTMTWDDDRKAAAFISGRNPTVLRLSRNVTSAAARLGIRAINENFQKAMTLFTALEEHGIEYQVDPDSSYAELSQSETALDYLQFPSQTLDYRSGDCDDLSILYSSLLESVAIKTALVTIPGHLFMAFSLEMSEEDARNTFSTVNDLVFVDGQTWVPVETTLIGEGFLNAWSTAAAQVRQAEDRDALGFFPVSEAHAIYSPTWFDEVDTAGVRLPDEERVVEAYKLEMNRFVSREIEPLVRPLITRLGDGSSPRLENRVGATYARYGRLTDARSWFERAAREDYVPAIVNLGYLTYLEGDLSRTLAYFQQASRLSPDDPDVLIGLARVQYDLENYTHARENMELAQVLAPERAEPFAYITGGGSDAARASDAQRRSIINWSE